MDTIILQQHLNTLVRAGTLRIALLSEDGKMGEKTREAILLFQYLVALEPTGVFDFKTQLELVDYLSPISYTGLKMANLTALKPEDFVGKKSPQNILTLHALQNGIIDKNELAMFLAQCSHESINFTRFEESFAYRPERLFVIFKKYFPTLAAAQAACNAGPEAIAEKVYGGRMGNDQPGDGYLYHGRGYIQLTGKDNYTTYADLTGIDILSSPNLLKDLDNGATVAVAFWQNTNGLSAAGKAGDVRTATRLINGGYNGLDDRIVQYNKFLAQV